MNMPPHELPKYIQTCLAQGFSQQQVADSLGVDATYISQVCSQYSITEAPQPQFAGIDALYEELEMKALKQLKLAIAQCVKPMELLRIATSINATKRRSLGTKLEVNSQQAAASAGIVRLSLPKAAVNSFIVNERNEAIGWTEDGQQGEPVVRSLLTASSQQLQDMAVQHKAVALLNSRPPAEDLPTVADEDM